MIRIPDGVPFAIPDDWITVELSHQEIHDEAYSGRWHGQTSLDYIVLDMLAKRGIRVAKDMTEFSPASDSDIDKPVVTRNHEDGGITVHQGPAPPAH